MRYSRSLQTREGLESSLELGAIPQSTPPASYSFFEGEASLGGFFVAHTVICINLRTFSDK